MLNVLINNLIRFYYLALDYKPYRFESGFKFEHGESIYYIHKTYFYDFREIVVCKEMGRRGGLVFSNDSKCYHLFPNTWKVKNESSSKQKIFNDV